MYGHNSSIEEEFKAKVKVLNIYKKNTHFLMLSFTMASSHREWADSCGVEALILWYWAFKENTFSLV